MNIINDYNTLYYSDHSNPGPRLLQPALLSKLPQLPTKSQLRTNFLQLQHKIPQANLIPLLIFLTLILTLIPILPNRRPLPILHPLPRISPKLSDITRQCLFRRLCCYCPQGEGLVLSEDEDVFGEGCRWDCWACCCCACWGVHCCCWACWGWGYWGCREG